MISYRQAKAKSEKLLRDDTQEGIIFGGTVIPREASKLHFLITGATGSGKTLTMRMLMKSVIPFIGDGAGCRALVYDAKRDMIPILSGLGVSSDRIKVFNPFDTRSVAWDMAKDITSPALARELARVLIPETADAQSYFPDTARRLLAGCIMSNIKNKGSDWTLLDIVLDCRTTDRLRECLSSCKQTLPILEEFDTGITFKSVKSTLDTRMYPYEIIAALWSHCHEQLSLTEWVNQESVLVLSSDQSLRSSMDALNRIIFQRVSDLILSKQDEDTSETWLFLDEVKDAGKLASLPRLATTSRSKGAILVLGFQDIEGMCYVYGRETAYELLGQCANKAILRLESPSTAKWAASIFGEHESEELKTSVNQQHQGDTNSLSLSECRASNVLPSEFLDIHMTSKQDGLSGFYECPLIGSWQATLDPKTICKHLAEKTKEHGFIPRADSEQYITPPKSTAREKEKRLLVLH